MDPATGELTGVIKDYVELAKDCLQGQTLEFDEKTGCITALVVPGPGCICGFLGREKEYVIPFCDVCQIGSDIILVSFKEKEKEKPDKKC